MAQQPGDTFTMDLLASLDAPVKRCRGRPRKENALSDAERARRYRLRKKNKKEVPPMWHGLCTGETWTGRGKPPKWFKAYIAVHGRRPDFY